MENYVKLIEAGTALLWPILTLVVIVMFAPGVSSLIESARWRKFTLKVGGQELSMEEVNEQQRALIADLQTQVASLGASRSPTVAGTTEAAPGGGDAATAKGIPAVLWIDDNPRNNSYLVQLLRERGVEVDLATSTDEGLQRYRHGRYTAVVSDMGREEKGHFNETAGMDLLKRVRERDKTVPFFIFCSAKKAHDYHDEAMLGGATAITSSSTRISGALLRLVGAANV